jgi:Ca2+/Na+ antiporter
VRYVKLSIVIVALVIVALVAVGLLLTSVFYEQQRGVMEASIATHQLDSDSNYIAAKGIMVNDYVIWVLRIIGIVILMWCIYTVYIISRISRARKAEDLKNEQITKKAIENEQTNGPTMEVEDQ